MRLGNSSNESLLEVRAVIKTDKACELTILTARSIFERALDIHSTDIKLWTRYIDAELREKNISHARNLLDRAVTILPRVNQLWFKYVRTEEALKDVARTREVYERWMKWQPDQPAWNAYINFELRYYEAGLAFPLTSTTRELRF
jgi:crooked neck